MKAELCPAKLEHSLSVLTDVLWVWIPPAHGTLRASVAAIIPAYHVDVFREEVAEVVSVRVVDHVLIEHRIGVAKDKGRQSLEIFLSLQVVLFKLLARSRKEHGVDLRLILLVSDPDMLAVEGVS